MTAALVAWLVARALARRLPHAPARMAGSLILDALFVGLIAARAAYVLWWWAEYSASPLDMLLMGDGGFLWWVGLGAALLLVWWRTRNAGALRRCALAGMAVGVLVWGGAGGLLLALQRSAPPLPDDIPLTTLAGNSVQLSAYAGRPLVVNLWATWCPPCRREMPVLAQAQALHQDVTLVLVNQGEGVQTVRDFLAQQALSLDHVLIDPHSRLLQEMGSRGLPTTLFFNEEGRLVDSHMGELTHARLTDTLRRRFDSVPRPDSSKE